MSFSIPNRIATVKRLSQSRQYIRKNDEQNRRKLAYYNHHHMDVCYKWRTHVGSHRQYLIVSHKHKRMRVWRHLFKLLVLLLFLFLVLVLLLFKLYLAARLVLHLVSSFIISDDSSLLFVFRSDIFLCAFVVVFLRIGFGHHNLDNKFCCWSKQFLLLLFCRDVDTFFDYYYYFCCVTWHHCDLFFSSAIYQNWNHTSWSFVRLFDGERCAHLMFDVCTEKQKCIRFV